MSWTLFNAKRFVFLKLFTFLYFFLIFLIGQAFAQLSFSDKQERKLFIPKELEGWKSWSVWGQEKPKCPRSYNKAGDRSCIWSKSLEFKVNDNSGHWGFSVRIYDESWLRLPGSLKIWPQNVKISGKNVPVVSKNGWPSIYLEAGEYRVEGDFYWQKIPQFINYPQDFGIVFLTINGVKVDGVDYSKDGLLWFKRLQKSEKQGNSMSIKVYRLIEDGIPMKLYTDIELNISGKSREENLGWVLPIGWTISSLKSPIEVALEKKNGKYGNLKAQVKAGIFVIRIEAFKLDGAGDFSYSKGIKPIKKIEYVGFKSAEWFRVLDIEGLNLVDVTQISYPVEWRKYPVYRWDTGSTFNLVEKVRGKMKKKVSGVSINREFWLDDNNREFVYRDVLKGEIDNLLRLNVAKKHFLGGVKINEVRQLVTRDPYFKENESDSLDDGSSGVEVRTNRLNLLATGRIKDIKSFPANGWQIWANTTSMKFNLPPGWRVFAIFGADYTRGDWLFSWSLMDIFLLLLFSIILFKLWNWKVALVGFLVFALCYHEPYSLRFLWFILFILIALHRNITNKKVVKFLNLGKKIILALITICLIPFISYQVQTLIYPQLERTNLSNSLRGFFKTLDGYSVRSLNNSLVLNEGISSNQNKKNVGYDESDDLYGSLKNEVKETSKKDSISSRKRLKQMAVLSYSKVKKSPSILSSNLSYKVDTKTQTGPAVPNWRWNGVSCGWKNPIKSDHEVKLILIPNWGWRIISIIRMILLFMLLGMILKKGLSASILNKINQGKDMAKKGVPSIILVGIISSFMFFSQGNVSAQSDNFISCDGCIPSNEMLNDLKRKILELEKDYTDNLKESAAISKADISLKEDKVKMELEVHVLIDTAVPVPGKFNSWSPISVKKKNGDDLFTMRKKNFLWVVLEKGIHNLTIEGRILGHNNDEDFELNFLLKPNFVNVSSEVWDFSGVRDNNLVGKNIIFNRKIKKQSGKISYGKNKVYNSVIKLTRRLEIGLEWKVYNTVSRTTELGKAESVNIKLLEDERVISDDIEVKNNYVTIRLGANDRIKSWNTIIKHKSKINLKASDDDYVVENWSLSLSPIWSVKYEGLYPIFYDNYSGFNPNWYPLPNEKLALLFSRPTEVAGDSITVSRVEHKITLGKRFRKSLLNIDVESSIGDDFIINLPKEAKNISKKRNGKDVYSNIVDNNLVIQLEPGKQVLEISWEIDKDIGFFNKLDEVKLPYKIANISTKVVLPSKVWLLFTEGPVIGPSVRFWSILVFIIIVSIVLSKIKGLKLGKFDWFLLLLGLTQTYKFFTIFIVVWFFLISWRGRNDFKSWNFFAFNIIQILVVITTLISIIFFLNILETGLLRNPIMSVIGNGSNGTNLNWFSPYEDGKLTQPVVYLVSIWVYRFIMLIWSLWLVNKLLKWSVWVWQQFTKDFIWKTKSKETKTEQKKN